ncbi:VCBS repeat domain-containing M23 family metallopeptidase [Catellatospora tritici]|uniref:VCBS repeat domain-containing M23 family metallopeptidase n=1 Tax=Catellatospora tritici TaxID=2851566 RepID=UPI001C2D1480|nr:VCBS repeat domain-containing M23 family metallopeptidase [Catellatospora tritici]MBV1854509.1 VCBS repeat domain-containing M23 family metallopeptidase [Catellatospora tritici]
MGRRARLTLRTFLVSLLAAVGATVVTQTPAFAAPNFKAPFPCGQTWTYSHHSAEVRLALDFVRADGGVTNGTPVIASAAGTAYRFSQPSGAGNYIAIEHGGGWKTYYFHLSAYSVPDGAVVAQGQQIGVTGSTGNSSGPHLHYEQLLNGVGQNIAINGVSLAPYPGSYNQKYLTSDNCGASAPLFPAGSPTDFNGDGKDDIVAFNLGSLNDVYVATSTGSAFAGTSVKWNDFFGLTGEKLLTGDFNGDGKDDVVTFTGGTLGDVYVGLSTGTGFLGGAKWHDWFAPGAEVPVVGDFNGDGKDDIATFTHDAQGDVFVALSTGTGFGAGVKWHEFFAPAGEYPAVGDFNGDGLDDIATFTQGPATAADVYVALSNGSSFGAGVKWHDLFAVGAELPRVGDFNGDGKDDIATFTCNADADVYAALSNGSSFVGTTVKWNDFFCLAGEFPYTGDYNGDGKDDIVVFSKGSTNDVFVGVSTGTGFLGGAKWHDFFGLTGETTL